MCGYWRWQFHTFAGQVVYDVLMSFKKGIMRVICLVTIMAMKLGILDIIRYELSLLGTLDP
jgi:hypothetical protein